MRARTLNDTAYVSLRRELRARPRRWLVTGAAGFIGSHCVGALLSLDQEVVALDSLATGSWENLHQVRRQVGSRRWARLRRVVGDIRDAAVCVESVRGVDTVLHQAAIGSVARSIDDPLYTHATNVDGFVNLAVASARAGVRSFVFASSAAVYGDEPTLPKREELTGRPISPYAATKLVNEVYAAAFCTTYDIRAIGLRYFNVVGPRQDPHGPYSSVVPRWLALLEHGQRPTIFGDGRATRDYVPVDNVVQANLLAAVAPARSAVYNVGMGEGTSLRRLFELLRDGMARRGAPCAGVEPRFEPAREGDITHSVADIASARRFLGYAPTCDLIGGLEHTMDWFRRGAEAPAPIVREVSWPSA